LYRFFKAVNDKPIDSAKLKLKDDVPEFVKQTGSFKKKGLYFSNKKFRISTFTV